jgi:daunorubicin resistance ABC transporter membrane protein
VIATRHDRATVVVLWRRDLLLFLRQRSRAAGALATTLLLWLVIGAGIAPSFASPVAGAGYVEYFFPGVILVLMLQVGIGATMSVIEDRGQGFLQGVLVAPGSRAALALGKIAGSTSLALIHAALFLALAPLAGFPLTRVAWAWLLAALGLAGLCLTGVGFILAWVLESVQGYHVVMNLVLFPLWLLSGAMFPATDLHPVLATLVRLNPMTYALSALRRALYGGALPDGLAASGTSATLELGVVFGTAFVVLLAACRVARRQPPA